MKRNYYIALIFTGIIVIAYFGYTYFYQNTVYTATTNGNSTTSTSTQPDFASSTDTTKILFSSSTPYYDLKYSVPEENKTVATEMASSAKAWVVEMGVDKINSTKEAEDMGITRDGKSCYEYNSDYTKYKSAQYVSYVSQVYSYTCGAHGSTYNVSYILDDRGNFIKNLSDVYSEGIYQYLSDYSRKVMPGVLAKNDIKISDIQDMFDTGTSPQKDNWNTFYFKGDTLVIIFGQYQIGPYVIGINELEVPLNNLLIYKK